MLPFFIYLSGRSGPHKKNWTFMIIKSIELGSCFCLPFLVKSIELRSLFFFILIIYHVDLAYYFGLVLLFFSAYLNRSTVSISIVFIIIFYMKASSIFTNSITILFRKSHESLEWETIQDNDTFVQSNDPLAAQNKALIFIYLSGVTTFLFLCYAYRFLWLCGKSFSMK